MTRELLKRAQVEGAPIIEGDSATFIWRGRGVPQLIGDFNRWDPPGPWRWSRKFCLWTKPSRLSTS